MFGMQEISSYLPAVSARLSLESVDFLGTEIASVPSSLFVAFPVSSWSQLSLDCS